MERKNIYEEFSKIFYSLIELNRNRVEHSLSAECMTGAEYAKEYKTVKLDIGRQVGKGVNIKEYIDVAAEGSVLIIVHCYEEKIKYLTQGYLAKTYRDVIKMEKTIERSVMIPEYKTVFIKEPSAVFGERGWGPEEIYRILATGDTEQVFVWIGT